MPSQFMGYLPTVCRRQVCGFVLAMASGVVAAGTQRARGDINQWLTLEPNATGNWGGVRTTLADRGLTFGGFIQMDVSKNLRGGIDTDHTALRYLLDLSVTGDTEKLWHWHGGTFFLDFQAHDGSNGSTEQVGDVQGFDSMDGFRFVQIYQLWYQQRLCADKVRLKIGKMDANLDFSVVEHGKEFLNSSMAYVITMFPMVTYPDPAPGAAVFFEPDAHWYAEAGTFYSNSRQTFLNISGHPEAIERTAGGMFSIGETGYRWQLFKAGLPGHAAVGGWWHSGEFPRLAGGQTTGTGGAYALLDQSLWHDQPTDGVTRDLGGFVEYGNSDESVAPVAQQVVGGLTLAGAIPGRPNDIVGAGIAWARLGDAPDQPNSTETALEIFYKLQLTHWAYIKSDVQYVRHPSGRFADALVYTARLEIAF